MKLSTFALIWAGLALAQEEVNNEEQDSSNVDSVDSVDNTGDENSAEFFDGSNGDFDNSGDLADAVSDLFEESNLSDLFDGSNGFDGSDIFDDDAFDSNIFDPNFDVFDDSNGFDDFDVFDNNGNDISDLFGDLNGLPCINVNAITDVK